jgi:diketogulonate reductase-like aldo/keto reductase
MKTVQLPDGERVPVLGQGTWGMGEKKSAHADEVAALRLGIDLGMSLIDTAEMYGEGGAEKVVADAIEGRGDRVFIVTKVYPHHASRTELPKACERSLKRLRVDAIDLYLLHWRGEVPLGETVETFEKLRSAGKIRRWGVSNFDVDDLEELFSIKDGPNCAADQVLYNLENREIEFDLLPLLTDHRSPFTCLVIAYSPVGHNRGLLANTTVKQIARRYDATPAQIALAWVLRQPGPPMDGVAVATVLAIPKASNEKHVRDNARSIDINLTKDDLADLDREFPPPKSKKSLPML